MKIIISIQNFHQKHTIISAISWVIILTILVFLIADWTYFDFFKKAPNNPIINIHAAFLIILTIILVCIAWIQLEGINKTAKADFLLRLDDRIGSDNIIKARPESEVQAYACTSDAGNL